MEKRSVIRIALAIAGVVLAIAIVFAVIERDDGVGEPCARQAGLGCLVVIQRFLGDAVYIEGTFSFIRVAGEGLDLVRELEGPGWARRVASVALQPGTYELRSYQRPCMAACPPDGPLDPPTDDCTASFTLVQGAQVTAAIIVEPGTGCSIDVTG